MSDYLPLIVIVFLAATLVLARAKGIEGLLLAFVFLAPWGGLSRDIGVTVTADRVVAALLLLGLLLRLGLSLFKQFTPYVLYFMVATVALSVSLPPSALDYTAAKGQWRWLFQIPMWWMMVAPGAAVLFLNSVRVVRSALRALLVSGAVLGLLGILQFGVFYVSGLDLFPIGIMGGDDLRMGMFSTDTFMGGAVFRACALAGEPKHLAYAMAICVSVLLSELLFGGTVDWKRSWCVGLLSIYGTALILTFSTQGLVLLGVNAIIAGVGLLVMKRISGRQGLVVLIGIGATVAVLLVPGLAEVLEGRTFGRIAEGGAVEDFNRVIWEWFRQAPWAWPFGAGLGNVHLYAAPYIPDEYLSYMKDNIFIAKSGALRVLSELGAVGVLVLVVTAGRPWKRLWSRWRRNNGRLLGMAICMLTIEVDYLLSADGPILVFFAIGATMVAAAVPEEDGWRVIDTGRREPTNAS